MVLQATHLRLLQFLFPWQLTLSQSPSILFQYFSNFKLEKKHLTRPRTWPNSFISLIGHADETLLPNIKMECQRWPKNPLMSGRFGTQYVAMVTKLLRSYCGAKKICHLLESYCKESNISDTNWLIRLFSSYLIKYQLSLWHHHLANCIFQKLEYPWDKKR